MIKKSLKNIANDKKLVGYRRISNKKLSKLINYNIFEEEDYKFIFDPRDCNKLYFDELEALMKIINPSLEKYNRAKKEDVTNLMRKENIICSYPKLKNCSKDEFFFEDKKQILLGRYFDTVPCFYKCKKNYFIMSMEPYSLFKNDVLIRYMIDKPELFINNSKIHKLETIFPVRIIVSKKFLIPSYASKKLDSIEEYTYDTMLNKYAVSKENQEIINSLPSDSILKKIITERFPINHIISREICILYHMKLYFYVVYKNSKLEPFILVSKYNMREIKKFYKLYNKDLPDIRLYFTNNF
jgi:hypothetical protein